LVTPALLVVTGGGRGRGFGRGAGMGMVLTAPSCSCCCRARVQPVSGNKIQPDGGWATIREMDVARVGNSREGGGVGCSEVQGRGGSFCANSWA